MATAYDRMRPQRYFSILYNTVNDEFETGILLRQLLLIIACLSEKINHFSPDNDIFPNQFHIIQRHV